MVLSNCVTLKVDCIRIGCHSNQHFLFLLINITFRISISKEPVDFCTLAINGFFLLTCLPRPERPMTTAGKDQVKKKVVPAPWRHWRIQDSPSVSPDWACFFRLQGERLLTTERKSHIHGSQGEYCGFLC
jgi:hypothetical protein